MDFRHKRFEKEESIVFREIAEEFILVPIRKRTADIDCFYTLNEVGARIWGLMDGRNSVQDILDTILLEYDVDAGYAERDLEELLQQLITINAIKEI
jgi:hypothetical protein